MNKRIGIIALSALAAGVGLVASPTVALAQDTVFVTSTGKVGIGTATPASKLHVFGSDGATKGLIQETASPQTDREILELRNNGNVALIFENTVVPERWSINAGTSFVINNQANGGVEYTLTNTGNLTIAGTLTENSDRTTKTDLTLVDPADVLARIGTLPVMTWRKIGDQALHMGPMAQDFAAAFDLGEDDRHIAAIDMAGASLAAIQGLLARLEELEKENAALARRLEQLERLEERTP